MLEKMKKNPTKKLTRKLRRNSQKYILTMPIEVIKEMEWQEKDDIIILANEKKGRIELYNRKFLNEKTRPYDFPISELKKRLKRVMPDILFDYISGWKKDINVDSIDESDENYDLRKMIKRVKIDIDNTENFPNELDKIKVPRKVHVNTYQDYWGSIIFSILTEKKNKYLQKYHEKNREKEEMEKSINKRIEEKIRESEHNKKLEILKEREINSKKKNKKPTKT